MQIPSQDQDNSDGRQKLTAVSQILSPSWTAWMNMKAPPMAFLKPKKPLGDTLPVTLPMEVTDLPWISWTKMKTSNTVPVSPQGLEYSQLAFSKYNFRLLIKL